MQLLEALVEHIVLCGDHEFQSSAAAAAMVVEEEVNSAPAPIAGARLQEKYCWSTAQLL